MNRGRSSVLDLMIVLACTGQAPAQETYTGIVVFSGKPVSGVAIWLQYEKGDANKLATRSDANGRFHLNAPKAEKHEPLALIARADDGRIGWRYLGRRAELQLDTDEAGRIELLAVGDARSRLTDAAGRPIANARVELARLIAKSSVRFSQLYGLPPELAKLFATTTTEDGTLALRGIPVGAIVDATMTAPGYGELNLRWQQGQTGEFRLEKPGRVRLRFNGVDDARKLAGLTIAVRVTQAQPVRPFGHKGAPVQVSYHKEVKSGGTETLEVDNVLPGNGQIRLQSSENAPFCAAEDVKVVVNPGEATDVTLTLAPAARVRGRVVDRESHKGIVGAGVAIQSQTASGQYLGRVTIRTGSDGTYFSYIRPGRVTVSLNQELPAGYVAPAGKRSRDEPVAVVAKRNGDMDFYNSGLMQLANVLTAAPEQRLKIVMGLNSGLALREEDW